MDTARLLDADIIMYAGLLQYFAICTSSLHSLCVWDKHLLAIIRGTEQGSPVTDSWPGLPTLQLAETLEAHTIIIIISCTPLLFVHAFRHVKMPVRAHGC